MSVQTAPVSGLRERKKERTRQALITAAFDLFQQKGFDATTVEEIAAAVEVSKRTFFRYFGSKEDLALSVQDDWETAGISELAARPPDEPVMTAIRRAVRAGYQSLAEDNDRRPPYPDGPPSQRLARFTELMSTSPALFGASLQRTAAHADDLVGLIAERMGADPATDLRPHLAAAAAQIAVRTALETFKRAGGTALSVADDADKAFSLLEESINYPAAPDSS
jgi:AcrR family transcriptional regulator